MPLAKLPLEAAWEAASRVSVTLRDVSDAKSITMHLLLLLFLFLLYIYHLTRVYKIGDLSAWFHCLTSYPSLPGIWSQIMFA